jgi:prepilin-type N-terminal cleavage/methylation domain-containing protein
MTLARRLRRDQEGFTLVELLVYVLLFGIILVIVGGMLINSTRAERGVRGSADASNLGQLISQSVQRGVRNAVAISLPTTTDHTQLLTVLTAGTQTPVVWSCQSWYYTPDNGGAVYTKKSTPAAAIAAPTAGTLGTWMKLGTGIVPVTGDRLFNTTGTNGISVAFRVSAGDRRPVLIQTTAMSRSQPTAGAPCI